MNELMSRSIVDSAIKCGRWRDPGPERLSEVLGVPLSYTRLRLFETLSHMDYVHGCVARDYVQLEEFGLPLAPKHPPTLMEGDLALSNVLFIAGSIDLGDDVFVASSDLGFEGPQLYFIDWDRPSHEKWRRSIGLIELVEQLQAL